MQPDGSWRPVAFYSRKLQGERAGTTKEGFTRTKHTGQYGWTPREKETYAIVSCLLKFQSWIGGQEITVKTDHSAIVKWYKEDLCTLSGPLGRRGRWHEFLSRFNLLIEYTPGPENHVEDALSRWAYPAGTAQDTNFHGGDADLAGWQKEERKKRELSDRNCRTSTLRPILQFMQSMAGMLLRWSPNSSLSESLCNFGPLMTREGNFSRQRSYFYTHYRRCRTGAISLPSLPPLQYAR